MRLLIALASLAACAETPPTPVVPAPVTAKAPALATTPTALATTPTAFSPPPRGEYPDGEFGDAVRRGEALFHNVQKAAPEYSGNSLTCSNCHIDDGRRADAAPMWAAFVSFPAYRGKNDHVNDLDERLRGCFRYSLNAEASPTGHAPPPGDPHIVDLEAYAFWLATGAPVGAKMPGRGFPKLDRPADGPNAERGALVYAEHCEVCHGADGQGAASEGEQVFPKLWGPDSYNWGAGMHQNDKAAGFIYANMPLGQPGTLAQLQAWDVAAYMNSQERPQDPRDSAGVAATDKAHHDHDCAYGERVDGHTLGRP